MTPCPACNGSGWLCEEHTDQPWEHDDCGGAGVPCCCNPHAIVGWLKVIAHVEREPDEPLH